MFHWGMVKAIYSRLEEIFGEADTWRISSPAGTGKLLILDDPKIRQAAEQYGVEDL
jgi:hypothetical protein